VGRAEGETWGLQNFALGFELGLPSEWYLQQYIKKLRPRFSGAFASNVPDPLRDENYRTETSSRWPPTMAGLPASAVVVQLDFMAGGPVGIGKSTKDTPF